jgi:hypothetical protein
VVQLEAVARLDSDTPDPIGVELRLAPSRGDGTQGPRRP